MLPAGDMGGKCSEMIFSIASIWVCAVLGREESDLTGEESVKFSQVSRWRKFRYYIEFHKWNMEICKKLNCSYNLHSPLRKY
jgi:hypothetical protein